MKSYYSSLDDVVEFMRGEPKVQYRYFFAPSKPLTSGMDVLRFDKGVMAPMIQIGKDDA